MVHSDYITNNNQTPQNERADIRQSRNNADGYSFEVSKWDRLDRFLILGSEAGTYYVSSRDLTRRSTQAVKACLHKDGMRTLDRATQISDEGRAHTNDPAIFILAMALKLSENIEVRRAAAEAVPMICRIPTHLFRLAEFVDTFGGWGRLTKRAFADWYNNSPPGHLAYHLIKYQQRGGWSNADLLRLSHPNPPTKIHDQLYGWVTNGWDEIPPEAPEEEPLQKIWAFEQVKKIYTKDIQGTANEPLTATLNELGFEKGQFPSEIQILAESILGDDLENPGDVWTGLTPVEKIIELAQRFDLPRECIPGEVKNHAELWEALLEEGMPMHALRRNLAKMTSIGVLTPTSKYTEGVTKRLTNCEALKGSRTHPLDMLKASKTYASGSGFRGNLSRKSKMH